MSTSWYPVERDRAAGARSRMPLSMRISCAPTRYSKLQPVEEQRRRSRRRRTAATHQQAIRQLPGRGEIADRRRSAPGARATTGRARSAGKGMEPLGRAERRRCQVGLAHSTSARICSRIDVADLGGAVRRQGRAGDDAVVGAGGVDDQAGGAEHLSSGPRVTSICWTRTNGTIVSVWNSQPRTVRSSRSVNRIAEPAVDCGRAR